MAKPGTDLSTLPKTSKQLALGGDREPWEKQKGESIKAFEAFALYRDLSYGRTLPKVALTLKKSEGLLGTWSRKNQWVLRCEAYDMMVDSRRLEQTLSARDAVARSEGEVAESLLSLVRRRLDGDPEDSGVVQLHPNMLDASDITRFVEAAFKRLRMAHGMATDNMRSHVTLTMREFEDFLNDFIKETLPFVEASRQGAWLERIMETAER